MPWVLAILGLGFLWTHYKGKASGAAPAGWQPVASAELDSSLADDLLEGLKASGQSAIEIGDYMARWEFVRDDDGKSHRVAVLYQRSEA